MNKSIVLCSGGLNSAVLVALAKESEPITLLHARYERPAARREADLAARLAGQFKIADSIILDLPHVAALRSQLAATTDVTAAPAVSNIAADAPIPGLLAIAWLGYAVVGTCSVAVFSRWRRVERPDPARYCDCGYPLYALTRPRCPECGVTLDARRVNQSLPPDRPT